LRDGRLSIDGDLCDTCGLCAAACHAEALEVIGRPMSVEAVMTEIRKDKVFFDHSGGGVTVSGGEPLAQPNVLEGILRASRQDGIHTALDTSGYGARDTLLRIAEYVDLFLWDIKVMDDEAHRRLTGASNEAILENLEAVSKLRKDIVIRFTLIPGVNDGAPSIREVGALAASLDSVVGMDLLPYHNGWVAKYMGLNRTAEPAVFEVPSAGLLTATATKLAGFGLKTRIGG
jgi:pyruvate formate lyase activating enzyme